MGDYPEVYVIILNYNSYNETIECVNSLKNISYPNYKIILVDNSSSDESVSIIRQLFPKDVLLISDENKGYAYGNNIGIKYALSRGIKYICLLNNDVVVEQGFLEPLMDTLRSNNKVGMVGPCICDYSKRDLIQAMGANINLYTGLALGKYKGKRYDDIERELIKVDYLGGACFLFKREVVDKIGLIPENYFLFFEETEFCLKAKRIGFDLFCLHKSRVYHKRSATIAKYKGLSYFFLNMNRIVFIRRNANWMQKTIFSFYIIIETLGRMLLRRETLLLFKLYFKGLKADLNSIDMDSVKEGIYNK